MPIVHSARNNQTLFVYAFVACTAFRRLLRHGFLSGCGYVLVNKGFFLESGKVLHVFACVMHLEAPMCRRMIYASASFKKY